MKIDFYGLRAIGPVAEPDLERELATADAVARAKAGEVVLVKIWLRTAGVACLEKLEQRIHEALAPLGLR